MGCIVHQLNTAMSHEIEKPSNRNQIAKQGITAVKNYRSHVQADMNINQTYISKMCD